MSVLQQQQYVSGLAKSQADRTGGGYNVSYMSGFGTYVPRTALPSNLKDDQELNAQFNSIGYYGDLNERLDF